MPIKDGSSASHYHTEDRIDVTRRIVQKIATSGVRSPDPQESVLGALADAPTVLLNHHRAAYNLINVPSERAARFITSLNLGVSSNVLFVGSGFGWTAEWIKAFMPGIKITCTDPGAWVQSAKAQNDQGDVETALDIAGVQGALRDTFMSHLSGRTRATEIILEEDCLSPRSRNKLRQAAGGTISHIITEHVLEWQWDDEAAILSDALRQTEPTARISHFVTPYTDTGGAKDEFPPLLNWKRVGDLTPVASRLTDQPRYVVSDWKVLLPNDEFV